ncbi:MAG: carboxypeptidase-like regulatory domain-containing protein [Ignavibacteriales bacterium]|nr:carboxypeptidase-like regulatory domain-containing protein [Ignavibacteriales bacterium]
MRNTIFYFVIFLFSAIINFGQTYNINGNIKDAKNDSYLSFANIRVNGTTRGTSSNIEGKYNLKLNEGSYTLIASYLGFRSDTIRINVNSNENVDFSLIPIEIELSEVTITPGNNPANEIIKNTIAAKNILEERIKSYKYSSYTKGLIKTTRDLQDRTYSLSTQDTGKLKITSILENESRGFYQKPDDRKHFIVARKQTANTPPFINVLTGGNVIQSFYEDDLTFMGKSIPSPISDDALSYYYFYIEKEIALDDKKIFQIYFNTDNPSDPGFYGKLFIEDKTFYLLKVDVTLNQMANPGGIFNYVNVYQQFDVFNNDIVLPIDYRLFAEGNYLGLAKFGLEFSTIMNSYEINSEIDEEIFDKAIISVLPEADKKDEIYWQSIQSIPNTLEEEKAYTRIDSLTRVSKTFGQDFSFLSERFKLNKNFEISGPLSIYSFNKIQGNTLNFDIYYNDAEEQRLNLNGGVSYGFSDKLVKKELSGLYRFGMYRTTQLNVKVYDKLNDLFGVSDSYNKFTSTFLSLFTKYDFRDYYYSKGFDIDVNSEIFPILSLGIGYLSQKDRSAKNNSDFSFFNTKKEYSANKQIFDLNTNAIKASFKLDFRNFIEDGFFRRRITPRSNIQFEGSILSSSKDLLKSDLDFTILNLETYGGFPTFFNWELDFFANKIFSNGNVPFQYLFALPGNINVSGKNNSFRTLRIGEVFGDDVTAVYLHHNFGDDLFRLSQIPILKDLRLQLATYLNVAVSKVTESSNNILEHKYIEFQKPFYELGFSLGHILIPISFEFTWKLNYRDKNNFVFGINTIVF